MVKRFDRASKHFNIIEGKFDKLPLGARMFPMLFIDIHNMIADRAEMKPAALVTFYCRDIAHIYCCLDGVARRKAFDN